jgi:hypothetical protein
MKCPPDLNSLIATSLDRDKADAKQLAIIFIQWVQKAATGTFGPVGGRAALAVPRGVR